jgi:hypothetical protein
MLVVNLFGAPGSGKSTVQADIYRRLKQQRVNAEIILEWAKMLTWEKRHSVLRLGQPYILGKTLFDMRVLEEAGVDVLVMDSPILLGATYDALNQHPTSDLFLPMVADIHARFDNINFMLRRTFAYEAEGRNQNADGSEAIDRALRAVLDRFSLPFMSIDSDDATGEQITQQVLARLRP